MKEYGNNGIFGAQMKQMRAVDGKQEIYFEWPKKGVVAKSGLMAHGLVAYGKWPYVFFQLYKYISFVLH